MDLKQLRKTLSPLELAELSQAAQQAFNSDGMALLRRLIFQYENPSTTKIEICERLMDRTASGEPKYHACIKGRKGIWAAGTSPDAALGDLVRCHPEEFNVNITMLPGKLPR